MKTCNKCKKNQPLSMFVKSKTCKDGLRGRCKECSHSYHRERRISLKDFYINNDRKSRAINQKHNMWYRAKRRALKKNIEFDIKEEDIIIPNVCPVLNISLSNDYSKNKSYDTFPSLDRFNNSKGYTKDNIHVISYRANSLKNAATVEEIKLILNYMENFNSVASNIGEIYSYEESKYNIWKIVHNANYRGKHFHSNDSEILVSNDIKIPKLCPILKIPIILNQTTATINSPSIDRICNDKGYNKQNIFIISNKANTFKNNASISEYKHILNYMEKYTTL